MNEIVERQDRSYTYDTNGNLTNDGIRTYTWDAENRLVAIGYLDQPEKRSQFQYDGLNRRAVMTETNGTASQTTTFLWDGTELLRGQTGAESTWYYAQGEIHGNRKLYYVQDRLGSVRETVGEDRVVTSRMSYTPYGVTETKLPPFIGKAPDYRYAGLFFHEASGLYLAVFRAYDPGAGRWISRNPANSINHLIYVYVNDNPLNNDDILGLWSFTISGYDIVGGGITVGRSDGRFFLTLRAGFGIGGGLSFNPEGGIPGPKIAKTCSGGVVLSVSGHVNLNAGPVGASVSVGAARNLAAGKSIEYIAPSAGLTSGTGIGAAASIGGQITLFS